MSGFTNDVAYFYVWHITAPPKIDGATAKISLAKSGK